MKKLLVPFLMIAVALAEPYVITNTLNTSGFSGKLFEINVGGKKIIEFEISDYKKATNEHPDVEFKVAIIYAQITTNTTMEKVVDRSYGCAVYGCTQDHSVTYWKQEQTVRREKIAEIGGQKVSLGVETLSWYSTNFVPVTTTTGMVFEATQALPLFGNPIILK